MHGMHPLLRAKIQQMILAPYMKSVVKVSIEYYNTQLSRELSTTSQV